MPSQRAEFPGRLGHSLAGRLGTPDHAPRAWAVFDHCFTCSKDTRSALPFRSSKSQARPRSVSAGALSPCGAASWTTSTDERGSSESARHRPLLVMHSPQDTAVDVDNARRIFQAALRPESFVALDRADHLSTRAADARFAESSISFRAARYVPLDARSDGPRIQDIGHAGSCVVRGCDVGRIARQRIGVGSASRILILRQAPRMSGRQHPANPADERKRA